MNSAWIKSAARRANSIANLWGLDLQRFVRSCSRVPRYLNELRAFRNGVAPAAPTLRLPSGLFPILGDYDDVAGVASGHYFHQDLWAARKIFERRPARHFDVGSRIDGFVAHVLTFMPVTVIDVRALVANVTGLSFVQDDATELASLGTNTLESISSLHAIEHVGLGRYGDRVDANACFSAMAALKRVLRPGGRLYFSVPMGIERVEFNAHRVFAPSTILREFADLSLVSFAAVDDRGCLQTSDGPSAYERASFACGLFEFAK